MVSDYFERQNFFNSIHKNVLNTGTVQFPDKATLELTMRCNLNCYMCHRDKNFRELNTEGIKKEIDAIEGVDKVHLTGGEIFLRRDIFEILDYLKDKELSLNTNGTLLTEDKLRKLQRYDNISRIGFSIDGISEVHNKIRGLKNAFERTVNAILQLSADFPVTVNTVVLGENISELDKILVLARKLSAEEFRIELEMFCTPNDVKESNKILGNECKLAAQIKAKDAYDYQIEKFREVIDKLKQLSLRLGLKLGIGPKVADIDSKEFYLGNIREKKKLLCKHLLVARADPEGNLVYCHSIKKSFGSLLENSLKELWNGKELKEFRKTLLKNNLLPICKRCCRLRSI